MYEKLVQMLQRPIGSGGTSSEDSYQIYDPLRLEAATALTLAQARVKELETALAGLIHNIDTTGGTHGAMSDARRALTQEQPNVGE